MIAQDVRAIVFDAVGTLLIPHPPAIDAYFQVGAQHNSQLTLEQVAENFLLAFRAEEEKDLLHEHRTSEERELQRWRDIVHNSLPDVQDPDACFEHLYQHFATAPAWKLTPGIGDLLDWLHRRNYSLAIGSNYDHRLRAVVDAFPELSVLSQRIISSEVGWKKPSPNFFVAVCDSLSLPPEQILFIGDDLANDYEAAKAAGLQTLLYDFNNRAPVGIPCISAWDQLTIHSTD